MVFAGNRRLDQYARPERVQILSLSAHAVAENQISVSVALRATMEGRVRPLIDLVQMQEA